MTDADGSVADKPSVRHEWVLMSTIRNQLNYRCSVCRCSVWARSPARLKEPNADATPCSVIVLSDVHGT